MEIEDSDPREKFSRFLKILITAGLKRKRELSQQDGPLFKELRINERSFNPAR